MAYQDSVGAEGVPVRAAARWVSDPLPGRGLYQLPEHVLELTTDQRVACTVRIGAVYDFG